MADRARLRKWSRTDENAPREIEPSAAAPRSTEQEPGEIGSDDTPKGGDLQEGSDGGDAQSESADLLRPVENEADTPIVARIFEMINAGLTVSQAAQRLNDDGFRRIAVGSREMEFLKQQSQQED